MTRAITLLSICLGVLLPLIAARSVKRLCSGDREYKSCTPTCDNLKPNCPKARSPGCVCGSGTVDNGLGECVNIEKCDFCSGNTTYISCGRLCFPQQICAAVCVEMCVCKSGYVSLPNSDRCVLRRDLP
ncbi:zonadhesin-like [Bufo gargarizans]|uniref:zonadhesin-like n=1 Tax=Bufo gargarizans TaxID=30331 RepID=UPI001CF429FA|nr:zonadhesin-like [Bufo gargarizans]